MPRDKKKDARDLKRQLERQISAHVRTAFPGCTAEFCGQRGAAAKVARTLGFRVRDTSGKYRSNIVWLNPDFDGEVTLEWVRSAVEASNG